MVILNDLPMKLHPKQVSARPCQVGSEFVFTQAHIEKHNTQGHIFLLWVCRITLRIALAELSYMPFLLSGVREEWRCIQRWMIPWLHHPALGHFKPQITVSEGRKIKPIPKQSGCFW